MEGLALDRESKRDGEGDREEDDGVAFTLPLCTGRDYILGLTFLAFSPQVPLARVVCGDAETLPLPPATRSPRHRRAARTLRLAPAERQAPPTAPRIGWSR
ncbi:hypothetical protein AOLI_G00052510 [Acnodon oligacanthus]